MAPESRKKPRALVAIPHRLQQHLSAWIQDRGVGSRVVPFREEESCPRPDLVTGAVLWSWTPAQLAERLLDECPRLRWLHSTWTGLDHLPVRRILERRVTLTNARGTTSEPIAEWVAASVLWHFKCFNQLRSQAEGGKWAPIEARDVAGSKALVVGTGALGSAIGWSLARLGMEVRGVNRTGRPRRPFADVLPASRLSAAASEADVLILSLPLTARTVGLASAGLFDALPDGAGVINVGRGETLDTQALLPHLLSGRLWAALDVFPTEPLPRESPLWRLPNVLVSPHSAHASPRHRERQLKLVCDQILRHLEGRRLRNTVPRAQLEGLLDAPSTSRS